MLRLPPLFRRVFITVLFLAAFLAGADLDAQTGGRKREGRAKTKKHGSIVLNQYKSRGHADEFARGNSGRRGWFSRLFKKDRPAWNYRTSGSARSNYRENRFLFSWNRTQGKHENMATIERQNKERARQRNRGNKTFKFKKHHRKK